MTPFSLFKKMILFKAMNHRQTIRRRDLGQRAVRDYYAPDFKNKKKKNLLFFLLTVVFIIYVVFYSPAFSISKFEIEKNNQLVNVEETKKEIETLLNKNIYFIFPQKNIFLFRTKSLIKKIKENPGVEEVKINKKYPRTLIVEIKGYEPQARLLILGEDSLYFLNAKAQILPYFTTPVSKSFSDLQNDSKIPLIYDQTSASFKNQPYLETLKSTLKIINHPVLTKNLIKIDLFLISEKKGIFEIKAMSKKGCAFIFTSLIDFDAQLTNLGLVLKDLIEKKKGDLSQLEYINLGFGEKIFYKFKTKEKQETTTP